MAEALAVLGAVGAVFNVISGISKTIDIINDLTTRWEDADLTLLTLASQLTALRAAVTKIQEWTDRDSHELHHQLTMDLEVSIKCCGLLINRIEGFFSDLASLNEKPLDLRNKFKVVFGSAGPESVQKLLERQTSALTLLLTACNCNTLSEQQQHLQRSKTRKVLDRAQADSISLCVQRDTASFATKMTDNLSKISRVFEFDSSVFSTRVYERAFRGSVKNALRQKATARAPALPHYEHIYLLGDELSRDLIINAIGPRHTSGYPEGWIAYRLRLQQLCVDLVCAIIKKGTPDWDAEQISILISYSQGDHEARPKFSDALDACAILWWGALRRQHEPDPDPQGYLREKIVLNDMTFHVDIIPAGGLNIYCGNAKARYFMAQIEYSLPLRTTQPRYAPPSLANTLRAKALLHSHSTLECRLRTGEGSFCLTAAPMEDAKTWPSFDNLQSALAVGFIFDLQDYSDGTSGSLSEMQARLGSSLLNLSSLENRGAPSDLPFVLLLSNSEAFKKQLVISKFIHGENQPTREYVTALSDIEAHFRQVVKLPLICHVLQLEEDSTPTSLIQIIENVATQRNIPRHVSESES
ncbi:hypothetical protein FB567DRAFT_300162 [Paraphoma chrysanthemicola]|uniref:Fungal N-terminal domain-containing protein n=1 Tax=Paraphoma chrysanthemicola TaxID=798071 RepID=A0A8K0RDT4_9PLEO|nr:hypothetical protein FB567DRAFT_300162 [Paraphoma chrysanthemicola]